MKKLILSFFVYLLVYQLYSCGGGGGTSSISSALPEPPRVPAFINISSSYLTIFARWSSINNANYYNLYYSQYSSLPLKNYSGVVTTKVYRNFTSITTDNPGKHYLTVTAVNDVGESKESKRVFVYTTNTPPPLP